MRFAQRVQKGGSPTARRSPRRWRKPGRRGVSDVVATILLLALTVTLFAAIFAWVTAFPSPPPQNNNQFQASLRYTSNLTYVNGLSITHLAGPSVSGTGQIYLASSTQPTGPEFASPYSISSGLGGASTWNLGQIWNLTFPLTEMPKAGGNITVYVVVSYQLLFSVILPGTTIAPPPTVTSTAISPATPTIGTNYTVYATISGSYTANSVYVNLAAVPGGPSSPQKMTLNSQGFWTYTVPSGATANGTFYGFVNASNGAGGQSTGIVVITIYPSSVSTGGPLSVGVVLVPSPPNSGTTESVQAVVTYTGAVTNAGLTVSFSGTSSPAGFTFTGTGPSGLTISGPSSVTVVSQTAWNIPGPSTLYTYTVTATATVAGVGTVTGTTTFEPVLITTVPTPPTTGLIGSSVTVTGSAFSTAAGSTVTLSVGGIAAAVPSCTSGSVAANVITPAVGGGFVCTMTVPNGAPAGATSIVATDASTGQSDTAAFTVTAWTISPLSVTSGVQATSVTVTATGFVASSGVTLAFDGISVTVSSCSVGTAGPTITASNGGAFTCIFKIPYGSRPAPARWWPPIRLADRPHPHRSR